MIAWLSITKVILGLVRAIVDYVSDKELMDAGAAKVIKNNLEESQRAIQDAIEIRNLIRDDPDNAYLEQLRQKYTVKDDEQ